VDRDEPGYLQLSDMLCHWDPVSQSAVWHDTMPAYFADWLSRASRGAVPDIQHLPMPLF
jgi:hypothetical protein